jgi:hypothetical protein
MPSRVPYARVTRIPAMNQSGRVHDPLVLAAEQYHCSLCSKCSYTNLGSPFQVNKALQRAPQSFNFVFSELLRIQVIMFFLV